MIPVIKGIDHIVITVSNLAKACHWYEIMLGMKAQVFTSPSDPSKKRYALVFGDQKINLHEESSSFKVIPMAEQPRPGSSDLCLWTDQPVSSILKHWQEQQYQFPRGPLLLENNQYIVKRTGAKGPLFSIYIYDLDGNLIEVANRCPIKEE